MTETFYQWHSPSLSRNFRMLVFGERGRPVILFPTSMGTYFEHKDQGMIEVARGFLEQEQVKIYCPDSIDAESWYNTHVHPSIRAYNHTCYDRLLLTEIVPKAIADTGYQQVVAAGCSFGGYHAANFAFRHPEIVSDLFSMSGAFDITSRMDGYYDDNVYFNNPMDYLPGISDPLIWKMGIILGTAAEDICRDQNEKLSGLLRHKNIGHWLDIRQHATHDWPVWKKMFSDYLSKIT